MRPEYITFGVIYHALNNTPLYQSAHEIWSAYLYQSQKYDHHWVTKI